MTRVKILALSTNILFHPSTLWASVYSLYLLHGLLGRPNKIVQPVSVCELQTLSIFGHITRGLKKHTLEKKNHLGIKTENLGVKWSGFK